MDGKKVVIGSHHFVFEDEGCVIPEGEQEKFDTLPEEYSHLFLGVGGVLSAVICVKDPLREEAGEIIDGLHKLGIPKLVMMTGDSERTARSVAQTIGIDEYYSEVLPEDKANYIRREHEAGRKVIMLGDGVNDSPCPLRGRRGHRHPRRRGHRARGRGYHHRRGRPVCPADAQARE